jgi:hypothetical protein
MLTCCEEGHVEGAVINFHLSDIFQNAKIVGYRIVAC